MTYNIQYMSALYRPYFLFANFSNLKSCLLFLNVIFVSMKIIPVLYFLIIFTLKLQSQGCSDAGACSIGGLKTGNKKSQYVSLNLQYGVGEQDTRIFVPQIEGVFKTGKRSIVQVKLPYVFTSGNLGTVNGAGDITAVWNYRFYEQKNWVIGFSSGLKIGVNAADKKTKNLPDFIMPISGLSAPMPYQTSLGTHDLLIGSDARYREKWLFGLAFQLPVYQFNRNNFDTALAFPNETEKKAYFKSAQLLRRPDIVLRVDRKFTLNKRLSITAGVLPIYHLGHDRFTDTSGVSHALSGSKGLTFNLNGSLTYELTRSFSLILRYAAPVITRTVRPDGLTRHWVSGLELSYSF
jgi:hypothetical protein